MPQQCEHPVGDEIDGGLVAGDQQQPPGRHDVRGGQALLGGQPGQQSAARLGSEPLDQPGQVLVHLRGGLGGDVLLSGSGVELGDDRLGPGVEAGLVLVRHPELLADHRDRQGVGEVVDEVDLVLALHAVDEVSRGAHHVRPHRVGLLEMARGQAPQSIMHGWVHAQKAAAPTGTSGATACPTTACTTTACTTTACTTTACTTTACTTTACTTT